MDESKAIFMANYVANLCAVWQANNYADYCARDLHDELENPPIEDFCVLAESMWDNFQKLKQKYK